MAYTKQTWQTGDTITAEKLNHIEDGVGDAYQKPSGGIPDTDIASASTWNGKITAPSSPANGAFLVWNGTAWVAQTLATWSGGNY